MRRAREGPPFSFHPETGRALNPKKTVEQVLKDCTPGLMAVPGVVGTGQGLHAGKPCILIMVAVRVPKLERKIPDRIEGYPVRIQVTGTIHPLSDEG